MILDVDPCRHVLPSCMYFCIVAFVFFLVSKLNSMRRNRKPQYADIDLHGESVSESDRQHVYFNCNCNSCRHLGVTCTGLIVTCILLVVVSVMLGWIAVLYFTLLNNKSEICDTPSCVRLANTILNSIDKFRINCR